MNIAQTPARAETTADVFIADSLDDLDTIRDPGCAAALWRRAPLPGFSSWIDALDPAELPTGRIVLRPDAVPEALGHLGDIHGLPVGPERDWFEADITALANQFTTTMRAPYLRLRLDAITTNACSKFHMDALVARLICTYRGTGTQYGLSQRGATPNPVFTLAPCTPIVMRGSLWPAESASKFLHRSPPIAGTGETRLVMVLDPVFDLEDA